MRFRVAWFGSGGGLNVLKERLGGGFDVVLDRRIGDDVSVVQGEMIEICDAGSADLIITSGGIGLSLSDRMPQVSAAIVDFEVLGVGEAIRLAAGKRDASAMFARVFAGVRHKTLILNLPGNLKALGQALDTVVSSIPSALESIVQ